MKLKNQSTILGQKLVSVNLKHVAPASKKYSRFLSLAGLWSAIINVLTVLSASTPIVITSWWTSSTSGALPAGREVWSGRLGSRYWHWIHKVTCRSKLVLTAKRTSLRTAAMSQLQLTGKKSSCSPSNASTRFVTIRKRRSKRIWVTRKSLCWRIRIN